MADVSLSVQVADAIDDMDDASDAVNTAGRRVVQQLAVLAEGAMKDEAPEGAGRDTHMRDTIDTRFSRGGKRADIGARKRVSDGTLLAEIVVEGTGPQSYSRENPPPIEPIMDWTEAKFGSRDAAWPVWRQIIDEGHETLPNPFVARSYRSWEQEIDDVATEAVRDALQSALAGGT